MSTLPWHRWCVVYCNVKSRALLTGVPPATLNRRVIEFWNKADLLGQPYSKLHTLLAGPSQTLHLLPPGSDYFRYIPDVTVALTAGGPRPPATLPAASVASAALPPAGGAALPGGPPDVRTDVAVVADDA